MTATIGPVRRDAWVEIDLDAIVHNVEVIRDRLRPGAGLAAVVKAEAYGHGAVEVASVLERRAEALAVATLDEALALRAAGIGGRIMLLYPVPAAALDEVLAAGIEPCVMSPADVEALEVAAARRGPAGEIGVHLALETGFHRGGLAPTAVEPSLERIEATPGLAAASCWSHLATPLDGDATTAQLERFAAHRAVLAPARPGLAWHLASSSAIALGLAPDLELARPGLALYGELDPAVVELPDGRAMTERLRPAMTVKARAAVVSDVPAGGAVGYGGSWSAARPTRVATLPLGYADGLARASQPDGEVLVRGRRVPLVGVVSMDSVGVDVTDIADLAPDDEFVILGRQGAERIGVAELARRRTTIAWEVLVGMAARLGRVYHSGADADHHHRPGP